MKVIEIIKKGLTLKGYDGLYCKGTPCGCLIDDLATCDNLQMDCHAGYKHTHSVTGEWIVCEEKEPIGDKSIEFVLGDY